MFTHSPTDARTYSFTKPQAAVDSDELSYADLGTLSNNVKPMSMAPVRLIISNYLGIYDKLVQSTPTYQALRSKVCQTVQPLCLDSLSYSCRCYKNTSCVMLYVAGILFLIWVKLLQRYSS